MQQLSALARKHSRKETKEEIETRKKEKGRKKERRRRSAVYVYFTGREKQIKSLGRHSPEMIHRDIKKKKNRKNNKKKKRLVVDLSPLGASLFLSFFSFLPFSERDDFLDEIAS